MEEKTLTSLGWPAESHSPGFTWIEVSTFLRASTYKELHDV